MASVARLLSLLGALALAACARHAPEGTGAPDRDRITSRDRFFDVATVDGETVVVVGYAGKVLRSTDGGGHWSRVDVPTDRSLLRAAMTGEGRVWAVGQDGVVLGSDDAGGSWTKFDAGTDRHLFGLAVPEPGRIRATGDRAVFVASDDGGAAWRTTVVPRSPVGMTDWVAAAVDDPVYYDVHFLDADTGFVVGDYGNIRGTVDGGRTWDSRHASLIGQRLPGGHRPLRDALDLPALFRVVVRPDGTGLVAGVDGLLFRTGDGGASWSLVDTGIEPRPDAPLLEIALGGAAPLVTGVGGTALRRDGEIWVAADLGLPLVTWTAAAAFAREGDHAGRRGFVVGGRGTILRTDDGGRSWRPVGWRPGGRPGAGEP